MTEYEALERIAEIRGRMAMIDRGKCNRAATAITAMLDALDCTTEERLAVVARVIAAMPATGNGATGKENGPAAPPLRD